MTPLARFLLRYLPASLATIALTLAYIVMLGGILVSGEVPNQNILYIDVRGEN
jgi:hypothetical protein